MTLKTLISAAILIAMGAPVTAQTTRMALAPGEVLGSRREAGELIIRAKFMQSPVTEHKTRLLESLQGFVPAEAKLDQYGGWIAGDKLEATGFFRTQKIGDRWWIIDPEGNRFIHMAVVSVSQGSSPQMKRAFPEKFGTKEK